MIAGQWQAYAIPMRTRFRGIDVREGMLVQGPAGWAEWSPFWDYGPTEAGSWLRATLEAAHDGWPAPRRTAVPVNVTIPAVAAGAVAGLVHGSGGCRTAKVKVAEPGQADADAVERVAAARDALGGDGRVRVDANGAWTVEEAVRMIRLLDAAAGGLEYVEQPCRTLEELAAVRRRVDVPIAADESIRRADDPMRVVVAGAADIAVLKVQPLGGVRACLEIADRIGLPVVVSSALETSIGIAAGVALAAALPELPYACGLATVQLLTSDVVSESMLPLHGALTVSRPTVEPSRLAAARASSGAQRRWADRWADATRLLASPTESRRG